MNAPRIASVRANCACCGVFVKGGDSMGNKTTIDTCLAVDKGFATDPTFGMVDE